MKHIQVNSEKVTAKSERLSDLLIELGYADAVVATAVNGDFVTQGNRANIQINDGDRIEVLAPMQGG
ncbi:sulfur carrier protein ThiS [Marinomonas ushuaiensis DSM 15871]|uniref:Sulfur carrier protein ThiS n=1 Tax=Marinomonas ushuaiensis DSM 15871 TaxID=1122207 RepID=X7E561_9GAMM|nr:sulfur carrier protein ThiS [Marinomonas ushuaiensis]ETX10306.1 sulfur carrier protein ThiS [Marinomonas ushuaiensis DSM 15871]